VVGELKLPVKYRGALLLTPATGIPKPDRLPVPGSAPLTTPSKEATLAVIEYPFPVIAPGLPGMPKEPVDVHGWTLHVPLFAVNGGTVGFVDCRSRVVGLTPSGASGVNRLAVIESE